MKKIAILSGAGISAESGITTFRDSNGLWENYDINEVASIEGWYRNPALMIDFYNQRRKQLASCEPNEAHKIIAQLEEQHDVTVVTQNVDNLHERAGSSHIIHLHGELTKVCSEKGKRFVKDIEYAAIRYGDLAEDGELLRPFIVWFGENVPLLEKGIEVVAAADILIVIGTSLNVYPAAGLVSYAQQNAQIYVIDPKEVHPVGRSVTFIQEKATKGMEILWKNLYNPL
ncbi:MAG: NAD-dependent deacylase [Bacteroidales bacterium]|jgi:NAD-dependent deacetylase|nr:NAD-dependent deacylase [Bacteroidales bacterium]